MCLITVCPKGTSKNSEELKGWIRNGFKSQRDGSGFAYKKDGENQIYLSKGFFIADLMIKAIEDSNLQENDELIIHHRTSTGGSDRLKNTHPFVISNNFNEITQLSTFTDKPVMAHNGIFGGYSEIIDKEYNDTVHWILFWEPLLNGRMIEDPETFFKVYNSKISVNFNKLAFLFPNRDLYLVGDFQKEGNYYHSNSCYKDYTRSDYGGSSISLPRATSSKSYNSRVNTLDIEEEDEQKFEEIECFKGLMKYKTFINDKTVTSYHITEEFEPLTFDNASRFVYKLKGNVNNPWIKIKTGTEITGDHVSLEYLNKTNVSIGVTFDYLKNEYIRKCMFAYNQIYTDIIVLAKIDSFDPSKSRIKKLRNILQNANQRKQVKVFISKGNSIDYLVEVKSLQMYVDKYTKKFSEKKETQKLTQLEAELN